MSEPGRTGSVGKRPALQPRRYWNRRRRLRWAAGGLVALALLVTVAAWLLQLARRTTVRRPGEALPEITASLARSLPPGAPLPRFVDATAEAGLDRFRSFAGPRSSQLPEDMGSGAAWGDFDNDGDDDLFLVAAGGGMAMPPSQWAPSELYENRGDGTFRRVDEFPETRILGMAAAWGDADGDGWLDLVVTGHDSLLLLRNQDGRLRPDPALPSLPGYWAGATWGDFDNDGDADLYVCGYVRYEPATQGPRRVSEQYGAVVPFTLNPASFEPERNLLFQNDGTGRFEEIAALVGVSNPSGRSLGAVWHDFDQDGWLDLYVANDISDNALYLNRQETFEDAGLAAWVADYRGAMGLAIGDWNRDGDDDLFVTHWIAQENALYDSRLSELPASAPASAGASAGASEPDVARRRLIFADLAAPLGLGQIALQSVGWGTDFADFDNDGWLDLVVANGSTFETEAEPKGLRPQPPFLFWNREGKSFHDVAPLSPILSEPRVGRGLAVADYDADGDLDFLVMELDGGVRLLRNETAGGHGLELRLRHQVGPGSEAWGAGDGATVVLRVGDAELRRTVGGSSYLSQSSRTLHFGLGAEDRAHTIEVHWLGGGVDLYAGLGAGALWELRQGDPTARRFASLDASEDRPAKRAEAGRAEVVEFWRLQRAAMETVVRDGDPAAAIPLLRQALALKPEHEDSRYHLANCLAATGRADEALAELDELRRRYPESHRAHKQWGRLRALEASSLGDLEAASLALERSLEINPEETGSLLLLGELALLRGLGDQARQRLEWACRSNPRAVGGFFLRGYLAWKRGAQEESRELLRAAAKARGENWKPEGTVAEGDVASRMHRERSPLSEHWERWDGSAEPSRAFEALDADLRSRRLGTAGATSRRLVARPAGAGLNQSLVGGPPFQVGAPAVHTARAGGDGLPPDR